MTTWLIIAAVLVVLLVVVIAVTLLFDRAEYQIPVTRMGITSQFLEKSYLPVKLSPSGGDARNVCHGDFIVAPILIPLFSVY